MENNERLVFNIDDIGLLKAEKNEIARQYKE